MVCQGLWTLSDKEFTINMIGIGLFEFGSIELHGHFFYQLPLAQDLFFQLFECIIQSNALDSDSLPFDISAMILVIYVLQSSLLSLWKTKTLCQGLWTLNNAEHIIDLIGIDIFRLDKDPREFVLKFFDTGPQTREDPFCQFSDGLFQSNTPGSNLFSSGSGAMTQVTHVLETCSHLLWDAQSISHGFQTLIKGE